MSDISRQDAIAALSDERAATLGLIEKLPPELRMLPGLEGGQWSPKDLVGHLESWEEHLLNAFGAWESHHTAPIHIALRNGELDAVNAAEHQRRLNRTYEEQVASMQATRLRLIEAIEAIDDSAWAALPDPNSDRTMADLAGSLLGSADGPFRHDSAHLAGLQAFAEQHGATL